MLDFRICRKSRKHFHYARIARRTLEIEDETEFEVRSWHRSRFKLREVHARRSKLDEDIGQSTRAMVEAHHHRELAGIGIDFIAL